MFALLHRLHRLSSRPFSLPQFLPLSAAKHYRYLLVDLDGTLPELQDHKQSSSHSVNDEAIAALKGKADFVVAGIGD